MRKRFSKALAVVTALTLMSNNVVFGAGIGFNPDINIGQPGGMNQGSYAHGSYGPVGTSETVLESELNTTISEDYVVNQDTQAKAKKGIYKALFDTDSIGEINIDIDEKNWSYMLQNATDKPNVLASSMTISNSAISGITSDGSSSTTIENVAIKTKGNLTLSSVSNSASDRFSFKINTKKYISKDNGYSENQNWYGIEKFNLNNIYGDASMMKEYLSYELMSEMGIPTPYYCLVKVYVNNVYWGVYCMVEDVSKSLVKRVGLDDDLYSVYKCEAPGGDLIYNNLLDNYLNGSNIFDLSTYSDRTNVLSNYTGIIENKQYGTSVEDYDKTDDKEVASLQSDMINIFTWMKKLNNLSNLTEIKDANSEEYKTALEEILDVDEILRYFATNTYLVNLDSYQSEKEQNYCLALNSENGKALVIPWDYNYSFGGYGVNNASDMVNFNIDTPIIDVTFSRKTTFKCTSSK